MLAKVPDRIGMIGISYYVIQGMTEFSKKKKEKKKDPPSRCRPEQIFLHTVSHRTCLKESGQVQRYNEQVPLSRGN